MTASPFDEVQHDPIPEESFDLGQTGLRQTRAPASVNILILIQIKSLELQALVKCPSTQTAETAVPYGPEDFVARAEECVRLANSTKDEMIQRELLELRQIYLQTVTRLRRLQPSDPKN